MSGIAPTRKILAGVALAAALALGSATQGIAATKIVMSNDNNNLGLKGQTFEVFEKALEQHLGDKVDVDLHHSGSLFDQKTQVQGLQLGEAHFISPTAGIYSTVAPNIDVLLLPYMLTNPEAIAAATKDPIIQKTFVPDLEKKNIKIATIWINGPRNIGGRGKPVVMPEDMKGVKVRVQAAPVFLRTMEALGANPIAMNWAEAPTAMQQGVIDAVEPIPNSWVGSGLHQVADYVTLNEYVFSFYIVGTPKNWWDGLPEDIRSGVQAALDDATKWNWENGARINKESNDKIRELGKLVELNAEQKAAWKKAVAPVWKSLGEDRVGPEVMARLKEISAANP